MLDAGVLLTELQRQADPRAIVFSGWSTHRTAARRRWAHAITTYLSGAVDAEPILSPRGVTLAFDSVEETVFGSLGFVNPSIDAAATDLAGAWRDGVLAIGAGEPATDPATSAVFEFIGMDPADVSDRFSVLRTDLVTAFRSHSAVRARELGQIADAIHAATLGLRSQPSPFVVAYG
jgi:hypothetical protein